MVATHVQLQRRPELTAEVGLQCLQQLSPITSWHTVLWKPAGAYTSIECLKQAAGQPCNTESSTGPGGGLTRRMQTGTLAEGHAEDLGTSKSCTNMKDHC